MMNKRGIPFLVAIGILASLACTLVPTISSATAQPTPKPTGASQGVTRPAEDAEIPSAVIVNDEGGPAVIRGEVPYTNPFFTQGIGQPVIILEDQAGFIDRDRGFIMPVESQTLGQITSDFFTSPFTYSLALPIEPQGTLRDVDNDGKQDTGVMVFAVAYWENIVGDPFLEERDLQGGGWSTAYASTRASEEAATEREIIGGKLLVYAPDDAQGFPSDFGEDGLLFTEDDPIVRLPQGYTVVDLDVRPFVFDRAREQKIDLIEPEGAALDDFSDLSYVDAFDAMLDKMSKEYAFTEYKGINWDALRAEFRPRIEEAQRRRDRLAYLRALRDLLWRIPDGHVSGPFISEDFWAEAGGGLGLNIRELSDGRVIVTYVLPGSPAEQAGIKLGAEITEINGRPIKRAIDEATPWLGPFSTEHTRRLDQMLFAVRFPVGEQVRITYRNPDAASPTTKTLTTVQEIDSLLAGIPSAQQTGFELPLEYRLLDSGYAYVKIYSFFDDKILTIHLWERLMQALIDNDVPGLVIDLRENGGGWGYMADLMAAYFFEEELVLGNTGEYDESLGEFYFDPNTVEHFILPPQDLRYHGRVAVIISPDCASACEFFAYDLTLQDRAVIVGHYPTAGLGGGIEEFNMPEDVSIRFTSQRAVDAEGNIHIEGKGVVPDVRVPVTEESLLGERDVLLEAAIEALGG